MDLSSLLSLTLLALIFWKRLTHSNSRPCLFFRVDLS